MFQKNKLPFHALLKKKRKRPLCSACCSSLPFAGCMHEGILRLLSLQGTSPNSFSVNFHPLPNSDEPFLPPTPQWRICPRSLCPPLISFFFDCSLSADSMQRMQIGALLFARPLPWMNATLNEATLAHAHRGGTEHARSTISGFACPLWHAVTQTSNTDHFKWADNRNIHRDRLFYPRVYPKRSITHGLRLGPQKMIFTVINSITVTCKDCTDIAL